MDNEIKYTLEDGTEIDDQLLNTTDTTVLEEFEFTGKSGKKYKGDDSVAVTADKTSHCLLARNIAYTKTLTMVSTVNTFYRY